MATYDVPRPEDVEFRPPLWLRTSLLSPSCAVCAACACACVTEAILAQGLVVESRLFASLRLGLSQATLSSCLPQEGVASFPRPQSSCRVAAPRCSSPIRLQAPSLHQLGNRKSASVLRSARSTHLAHSFAPVSRPSRSAPSLITKRRMSSPLVMLSAGERPGWSDPAALRPSGLCPEHHAPPVMRKFGLSATTVRGRNPREYRMDQQLRSSPGPWVSGVPESYVQDTKQSRGNDATKDFIQGSCGSLRRILHSTSKMHMTKFVKPCKAKIRSFTMYGKYISLRSPSAPPNLGKWESKENAKEENPLKGASGKTQKNPRRLHHL